MIPSSLARARWQWQPTTTSHDPNPPIILEDPAAPETGQPMMKRWGGVPFLPSYNSNQDHKVWMYPI